MTVPGASRNVRDPAGEETRLGCDFQLCSLSSLRGSPGRLGHPFCLVLMRQERKAGRNPWPRMAQDLVEKAGWEND